MKGPFTVDGKELAAAVHYAAHWLAPRPAVPAHAGLLFEIGMDSLSISGFDDNTSARATLPADGAAVGAFVVAGRLIDALVGTFDDGPVRFEQHDSLVAVTAGRWKGTLPLMSESDYPTLPDGAPTAGIVDGAALADAVRRTEIAASRDTETLVALSGLHIGFVDSGSLALTATDRYRVAQVHVPWEADADSKALGQHALPYASVLADAVAAFDQATPVRIGWAKGLLSLNSLTRSLTTSTLGEEHPAAEIGPMMAYRHSASATIVAKELAVPLKRAEILQDRVKDLYRAVTLTLSSGLVAVSAGSESGDGGEPVDIEYDGPDCSVDLRLTYLRAALSSAPSPVVTMSFSPGVNRPLSFTSPTDETWQHIVRPIKATGGHA